MRRFLILSFVLSLVVACSSDDDDANATPDQKPDCLATCAAKANDDCRSSCEQGCRSGNCTLVPSFPWKDVERVVCNTKDGASSVSFSGAARGQTCSVD